MQFFGTIAEAVSTFPALNKDAVAFWPGAVVATHGSGSGAVLASASDMGKVAVAVSTDAAEPDHNGSFQTGQTLELSDWTDVTGSETLSPAGLYFLSVTPGLLTLTPPSLSGQSVQQIGRAVSPTVLEISITPPILR